MGWYYTIRIVLVFDGFFNYHFELHQHEKFLVCFWISVFLMFKTTSQTLGMESHTFWGNPK
jgi:hypothetical protein